MTCSICDWDSEADGQKMGDLERAVLEDRLDAELLVKNLEAVLGQKDEEILRINRHCEYIMELYYDMEERLAAKSQELLTLKVHLALCRCNLSDKGGVQIPMAMYPHTTSGSGSEVYPTEPSYYDGNTSQDLSDDETLRQTGTSHSGRYNSVSSPDERQFDTLDRMHSYAFSAEGLIEDTPLFPELHKSMSLDRPLSIAMSDISTSSNADVLDVEKERREKRAKRSSRRDEQQHAVPNDELQDKQDPEESIGDSPHEDGDDEDRAQVIEETRHRRGRKVVARSDALDEGCDQDGDVQDNTDKCVPEKQNPELLNTTIPNIDANCSCMEDDEGSFYEAQGKMNNCRYCPKDPEEPNQQNSPNALQNQRQVIKTSTSFHEQGNKAHMEELRRSKSDANGPMEMNMDFGEHAHLVSAHKMRPKAVGYTFDILPSKTKPKIIKPQMSNPPSRIPKPTTAQDRNNTPRIRQIPTKPVICKPKQYLKTYPDKSTSRICGQLMIPQSNGMRKARSTGNMNEIASSKIPIPGNIFHAFASSLNSQKMKSEKEGGKRRTEKEDVNMLMEVERRPKANDNYAHIPTMSNTLNINKASGSRPHTTHNTVRDSKPCHANSSQTYTKEDFEAAKREYPGLAENIKLDDTARQIDDEGKMNDTSVIHKKTYTKEDLQVIKQKDHNDLLEHDTTQTNASFCRSVVSTPEQNENNNILKSHPEVNDNLTKASHDTSIWSQDPSVKNSSAFAIDHASSDYFNEHNSTVDAPETTQCPHTNDTNDLSEMLSHKFEVHITESDDSAFFHPEIPTPFYQHTVCEPPPVLGVRSKSRPQTPAGYYDAVNIALQRPLTSDPCVMRSGRTKVITHKDCLDQVLDNAETATTRCQVPVSSVKPENNATCTSEDETETRSESIKKDNPYNEREHRIPHPPPIYPQTRTESQNNADLTNSTRIDSSISGNRRPQSARHRRRVRQVNTTKRPQSAGLPSLRQSIDGCYSDEMDDEAEQVRISRSLTHTATT